MKANFTKVCDSHPIAFETNHYPFMDYFYNPYRTRKVVMRVKVSALKLPENVYIYINKWSLDYRSGSVL